MTIWLSWALLQFVQQDPWGKATPPLARQFSFDQTHLSVNHLQKRQGPGRHQEQPGLGWLGQGHSWGKGGSACS